MNLTNLTDTPKLFTSSSLAVVRHRVGDCERLSGLESRDGLTGIEIPHRDLASVGATCHEVAAVRGDACDEGHVVLGHGLLYLPAVGIPEVERPALGRYRQRRLTRERRAKSQGLAAEGLYAFQPRAG